jgi:hypothetical protein
VLLGDRPLFEPLFVEVATVIGFEIEQLRHLIEDTLSESGMSDAPWYCVVEPSSQRRAAAVDRRPAYRSVRVVWKKREDLLEFFDENGSLFQTIPTAEARSEGSAGVSTAGTPA